MLADLAADFERGVGEVLERLNRAASHMREAAGELGEASTEAGIRSGSAVDAAGATSSNVTSVAAAGRGGG